MELPDEPQEDFSREQLEAFHQMRELLTRTGEADERYDLLEASRNGTVVSTDIARYLDVRYAKTPKVGRPRDLEPSWDLAWRYAQDRLRREVRARGSRKRVRFMSGGWGAGKTFALRNEPTTTPDLVWDGTLSEIPWAVEMIDLALDRGWKVEVAYVYRDLELALYGAIQRKREVGRSVPLAKLPKNHRLVQQTVLELTTLYRSHPSVSFLYLHNLGIPKIPGTTPEIELNDLEQYGALHYLERHERYYSQAAENLESADDA